MVEDKITFCIYKDNQDGHHAPVTVASCPLARKDNPSKIVAWGAAIWGSYNLDLNRNVNVQRDNLDVGKNNDKGNRSYCLCWTIRDGVKEGMSVANAFNEWIGKLGYVRCHVEEDKQAELGGLK